MWVEWECECAIMLKNESDTTRRTSSLDARSATMHRGAGLDLADERLTERLGMRVSRLRSRAPLARVTR